MKTKTSFYTSTIDKILISVLILVFLGIAITFIIQIFSFPLNFSEVVFRILLIIFSLIVFKCLESTLFYKIKFDPTEKSIIFGSTFGKKKIMIDSIKEWRIRGWVGGSTSGSLSISKKTYTVFECWLKNDSIFYYPLMGGTSDGEIFFENIIQTKPAETTYFGNPIIFSNNRNPSYFERIKYQCQWYGLFL